MGDKVESEEVRSKTQSARADSQNEKRNEQKQEFICDRCGYEMYEKNCKVVCSNCGNRFDCSDLNLYFD